MRAYFDRSGMRTEVSIAGHGRADAVDVQNRIIYEVKPNTPSGIAAGGRQLARYARGLAQTGANGVPRGQYTTVLILYNK
jgi:hypothetical protein